MRELLVIVPTRGRAHVLPAWWENWCRHTDREHTDVVFAVDDDDPDRDAYLQLCRHHPRDGRIGDYLAVGPRLRMVGTLNSVAVRMNPRYHYVGFMGDDHWPSTPGWDHQLTDALAGGTGIAYGNDLLQGPAMCTAVVMTSDIVSALGYMAPPAMQHLCVDLVWKAWGEALGQLHYLPEVIIEHRHPANHKAEMDAGYEDANSAERVAADSAAFYDYRDNGGLAADVQKLEALL